MKLNSSDQVLRISSSILDSGLFGKLNTCFYSSPKKKMGKQDSVNTSTPFPNYSLSETETKSEETKKNIG